MQHQDIYDRQIECLKAGDLDGLMDQYAEDAQLIRFDMVVTGKEALRTFFADYIAHIKPFELVSTDKYTDTEDAMFFEATVSANGNTLRVYDVFMIEEGKIKRHFAGILS